MSQMEINRVLEQIRSLSAQTKVGTAQPSQTQETGPSQFATIMRQAGLKPQFLYYGASDDQRSLARELGARMIRVNCLLPGLTSVEATKDIPQARWNDYAERTILKRTQQPDDLHGAVAFLLSDDAKFITGQTLAVDGGTGQYAGYSGTAASTTIGNTNNSDIAKLFLVGNSITVSNLVSTGDSTGTAQASVPSKIAVHSSRVLVRNTSAKRTIRERLGQE